MAESKRVVMVGIAGVGKTTLLDAVVEKLRAANKAVSVRSFGTVMLDEARRNGITDRDTLRSLPTDEQNRLQKMAAQRIVNETNGTIIIDTHAFVNTGAGYYPGLPERVLRILNPTNYISVSARPAEIYNRRMNDPTRNRDHISVAVIEQELDMQAAMVASYSIVSGSPVKPVTNREGKLGDAADDIIRALGL